MANQKSASSEKKDSVKHAPESGEPSETGPAETKANAAKDTGKASPGKPKLGEDNES